MLSTLMLSKACGSVLLWYVFPLRRNRRALSTLMLSKACGFVSLWYVFLEDTVTSTMY